MDKEIVRILIIAAGFIVVIGTIIDAYFKDKKKRDDDFDAVFKNDEPLDDFIKDDSLDSLNDTVDLDDLMEDSSKNNESDDAKEHDFVFRASEKSETKNKSEQTTQTAILVDDELHHSDEIVTPRNALEIIQFTVVSKGKEDFNGLDLFDIFEMLGLVYSSLGSFERLDDQRRVDFGVASMVDIGKFPSEHLEEFYTPGVVFFMQPALLDDAKAVFDDYVETIVLFAKEVDGVIYDHRHQKLSFETVEDIKQTL